MSKHEPRSPLVLGDTSEMPLLERRTSAEIAAARPPALGEIGFIGLGRMGTAMAANLAAAGRRAAPAVAPPLICQRSIRGRSCAPSTLDRDNSGNTERPEGGLGRDPAEEKKQSRRRLVVDRVDDLVETYIRERVAQTETWRTISNLLRRDVIAHWGNKSIHEISKRDVSDLIGLVAQRNEHAGHRSFEDAENLL